MGKLIKEHLSMEQLILFNIYEEKKPKTIEQLQGLGIPRTTLVEHLRLLQRDGLITESKSGRTLIYFAVPEIADRMKEALEKLNNTYAYALRFIQQRRLKELKG